MQGSCALWYNLHRSGAGDMLTRHAACPVLSGTKWGQLHSSVCRVSVCVEVLTFGQPSGWHLHVLTVT